MVLDIFSKFLNDEQLKIIHSRERVNLVFAGAGTGKTRIILYKIIQIIGEKNPALYNFFITTFTNKAADELRDRISKQFDNKKIYFPYLGTFHSLCARILRNYGDRIGLKLDFTIYDESDSIKILKRVISSEFLKEYKPELLLKIFSFYKENHYESKEKLPDLFEEAFILYEKALRNYNALDFSDLLEKTLKLFKERENTLFEFTKHLKYVFVDEFQDTNLAQYGILKLLWKGIYAQHNDSFLMVVGDENQSIYGFRNARVENILNFPKDFKNAKIFTLSKNYRSTQEILNVAKYLAFKNPYKTNNLQSAQEKRGEKVKYAVLSNDNSEAEYIISEIKKLLDRGVSPKEIAVFFRTNYQIRLLERYFHDAKLPYIVVGAQKFYERMEIKDILSYLKFIVNMNDMVSFNRLIRVPRRGIGNIAIDKIIKKKSGGLAIEEAIDALQAEKKLSKKQVKTLKELLDKLKRYGERRDDPSIITSELIEDIGYYDYLKGFDEDTYEFRKDNIKFLLDEIERLTEEEGLNTLFEIIERLSLYSSVDTWKKDKSINLMTLHLSKGLEFDAVFISGVEESIIPHLNSKSKKELEEEQRLLYVGITRGRKYVYLTRALSRYKYGKIEENLESQFIQMIPENELEIYHENRLFSYFYNNVLKSESAKNKENSDIKETKTDGLKFKKGDKVKHKKYGVGLVIDSYSDGVYNKVEVRFYKYGKKTIIEDYLESA